MLSVLYYLSPFTSMKFQFMHRGDTFQEQISFMLSFCKHLKYLYKYHNDPNSIFLGETGNQHTILL